MSEASLLDFDWRLPAGVRAAFTTRLGRRELGALGFVQRGDACGRCAGRRCRESRAARDAARAARGACAGSTRCMARSWRISIRTRRVVITADAAVARTDGRVCVVMVADCLPVLFASRDGRRIAAAHAGWRGLAAGVLEQTVAAMGVRGDVLTAWLGPAISQEHFEVGEEVRAAFVDADRGAAACVRAECARAMAGGSRRARAPAAGGARRHRCQRR